MEFYQQLNLLIKEFEITRYKLAKDINMGKATVLNWCEGLNEPKVKEIIKLAKYFNVSTDYLLGLTEDDTPHWDSQK